MFSIQTILYPTDFSQPSQYAFQLACSLARDHGASVILLHVVERPKVAFGDAMAPPPPLADYQKEAREELQRLVAPQQGIHFEHRLEEGDAASEIVRVAGESACSLIVLGTHGRTGLGHLLMGSVAEKVLRQAPCPVITVKAPSGPEEAGQDFSEEMRAALRTPHA